MMASRRFGSIFAWIFEDRRTGEIVIGQKPNVLLTATAITTAACFAWPRGAPRVVRLVNTGSFCAFGLDELTRGVNPFRRIGGALVLCGVLMRIATRRGLQSDRTASKAALSA